MLKSTRPSRERELTRSLPLDFVRDEHSSAVTARRCTSQAPVGGVFQGCNAVDQICKTHLRATRAQLKVSRGDERLARTRPLEPLLELLQWSLEPWSNAGLARDQSVVQYSYQSCGLIRGGARIWNEKSTVEGSRAVRE